MSLFERVLLLASTLLAAATGGVYFWMKYLMTGDDPFSVVHHPWQPHVLEIHVLVVPVLVFALGLISREHIVGRYLEARARRGRASGIIAVLLALPMIGSGYLVQVLTEPGPRRVVALIHAASGALYVLLFFGHLVVSRTGRRSSNGVRRSEAVRTSNLAGMPRVLALLRLDRPRRRGIESPFRSSAAAPRLGPGGRRP